MREAKSPAVISIHPVRLKAMLQVAKESGADLAIIDGAAIARDVTHMAAEVADFVLIPTKAAVFDTMSMTQTIDVVKQTDTPFSMAHFVKRRHH